MTDTAKPEAKKAAAKPAATKAADKKPAAKKAATKTADQKATPAKPKREVRTFDAANVETFKCQGACGETKPVKAFPTVTGTTKRAVECRADRDARTKAEKEARQKAKAGK